MEDQLETRSEDKIPKGSIVKYFQHFLNRDLNSNPEVGEPVVNDNSLEKLSEELIQFFNFNNLDSSTTSQKEKLVQKIIKLGGEDYTAEDLRRDILKIEMEDSLLMQGNQSGTKTKISQKEDRTSMGNLLAIDHDD